MTVAWQGSGPAAQIAGRGGFSPLAREDSDASMDFYDQLAPLDEERPRHAAVTVGSGDWRALLAGDGLAADAAPLGTGDVWRWLDEHPADEDWWVHPPAADDAQHQPDAAGAAAPDIDPVLLRWRSDDYQADVLPVSFQPLLTDALAEARNNSPPPRAQPAASRRLSAAQHEAPQRLVRNRSDHAANCVVRRHPCCHALLRTASSDFHVCAAVHLLRRHEEHQHGSRQRVRRRRATGASRRAL